MIVKDYGVIYARDGVQPHRQKKSGLNERTACNPAHIMSIYL